MNSATAQLCWRFTYRRLPCRPRRPAHAPNSAASPTAPPSLYEPLGAVLARFEERRAELDRLVWDGPVTFRREEVGRVLATHAAITSA